MNKIKILRELYLNYIKPINFLVSNEWTEEVNRGKWTRLFEFICIIFNISISYFRVSEQKNVSKAQTLRVFKTELVEFYSIKNAIKYKTDESKQD